MAYTPQLQVLQSQGGGIYSYEDLTFNLSGIADAATQARVAQALDVGLRVADAGGETFNSLLDGLQSGGPRTISFYDSVSVFQSVTNLPVPDPISTSAETSINGNNIYINPTGGSLGYTQSDGSVRPDFYVVANNVWHELMHDDGMTHVPDSAPYEPGDWVNTMNGLTSDLNTSDITSSYDPYLNSTVSLLPQNWTFNDVSQDGAEANLEYASAMQGTAYDFSINDGGSTVAENVTNQNDIFTNIQFNPSTGEQQDVQTYGLDGQETSNTTITSFATTVTEYSATGAAYSIANYNTNDVLQIQTVINSDDSQTEWVFDTGNPDVTYYAVNLNPQGQETWQFDWNNSAATPFTFYAPNTTGTGNWTSETVNLGSTMQAQSAVTSLNGGGWTETWWDRDAGRGGGWIGAIPLSSRGVALEKLRCTADTVLRTGCRMRSVRGGRDVHANAVPVGSCRARSGSSDVHRFASRPVAAPARGGSHRSDGSRDEGNRRYSTSGIGKHAADQRTRKIERAGCSGDTKLLRSSRLFQSYGFRHEGAVQRSPWQSGH